MGFLLRHSLQISCVLGDCSSRCYAHCAFSLSGAMGGETCIESELFEERVPVSKYRYTAGYVSGLFQRQSTLFCESVLSIEITAVLRISAPNYLCSKCSL